MKQAIKIIISLNIIGVIFTLFSCEKEDIINYHYEQVIIDPENPDYYSYSDSYNPERGWKDYKNREGKYYFELEGNKAILYPDRQLLTAVYLRDATDKEPVNLEISDKNSVEKTNVTKNGVFRLTFK